MALTKSSAEVLASTSNSAGGTTTGSWINVTDAYEGTIWIKVTNGGSGPTVGLTARIDRADDGSGTNTYTLTSILHDTTNSSVGHYRVRLPEGVGYIRLVASGNTGQAVTVESRIDKVTAL